MMLIIQGLIISRIYNVKNILFKFFTVFSNSSRLGGISDPLVHDHTIRNFNSLRLKVLNDAWEIGDYNSHSFGLILANCKVIWWMNGLSSSVSKNDMFVGRRTPWRPHHPHCASMMRGREWRQPATAWRWARWRQRSCTAPSLLTWVKGALRRRCRCCRSTVRCATAASSA